MRSRVHAYGLCSTVSPLNYGWRYSNSVFKGKSNFYSKDAFGHVSGARLMTTVASENLVKSPLSIDPSRCVLPSKINIDAKYKEEFEERVMKRFNLDQDNLDLTLMLPAFVHSGIEHPLSESEKILDRLTLKFQVYAQLGDSLINTFSLLNVISDPKNFYMTPEDVHFKKLSLSSDRVLSKLFVDQFKFSDLIIFKGTPNFDSGYNVSADFSSNAAEAILAIVYIHLGYERALKLYYDHYLPFIMDSKIFVPSRIEISERIAKLTKSRYSYTFNYLDNGKYEVSLLIGNHVVETTITDEPEKGKTILSNSLMSKPDSFFTKFLKVKAQKSPVPKPKSKPDSSSKFSTRNSDGLTVEQLESTFDFEEEEHIGRDRVKGQGKKDKNKNRGGYHEHTERNNASSKQKKHMHNRESKESSVSPLSPATYHTFTKLKKRVPDNGNTPFLNDWKSDTNYSRKSGKLKKERSKTAKGRARDSFSDSELESSYTGERTERGRRSKDWIRGESQDRSSRVHQKKARDSFSDSELESSYTGERTERGRRSKDWIRGKSQDRSSRVHQKNDPDKSFSRTRKWPRKGK